MRGVVCGALALALLCPPSAARATDTPSTVLSWSAPSACPNEAAAIAQIERYLQQPLGASRKQKLAVAVAVRTTEKRGFLGEIRVSSALGTHARTLENQNCAKLTEAIALVIALAIDPDAAKSASPSSAPRDEDAWPKRVAPRPHTEAGPATKANPTTESDQATGVASSPDDRKRQTSKEMDYSATLVGLAGVGDLPGFGVGAGARVGFRKGRFQMLVNGHYWFPRFEAVRSTPSVGVELDVIAVSVKPCWLPISESMTLALCAGPEVGNVRGTGVGLENERTRTDLWVAFQAELSLSWQLTRSVSAVVGAEFGRALRSPRFGVILNGEEHEVFASGSWDGRAFLGIGVF